jgi:hypothetical protein
MKQGGIFVKQGGIFVKQGGIFNLQLVFILGGGLHAAVEDLDVLSVELAGLYGTQS